MYWSELTRTRTPPSLHFGQLVAVVMALGHGASFHDPPSGLANASAVHSFAVISCSPRPTDTQTSSTYAHPTLSSSQFPLLPPFPTTARYGLQRIARDGSGGDSMLRSRVLGAMKRLATYQMAAPAGDRLQTHDWHRFRTVDLLRETVSSISNGRIGTATVIWTRHRVEYSLAEHIPSLLSSIPDWLGSEVFLPWLRDHVFAHTIREHHGFVLDWVTRRARALELTEKAAWPANSLALIAAANDLLQLHAGADSPVRMLQADSSCPAGFVDRLCGCPDEDSPSVPIDTAAVCARELLSLRSGLTELVGLRASFNLRLSLADFQGEAAPSIVARLLERVAAPELVAGVVTGEVVPFLAAKVRTAPHAAPSPDASATAFHR